MTSSITAIWHSVSAAVAAAAVAAGRDPGAVEILASVKGRSPAQVLELLQAGARLIGHNRVQEMAAQLPEVRATWDAPLQVHMIGSLQTNKINAALQYAECVQSVDRIELAEKLSHAAVQRERELDVFVQVNASFEATKSGVDPMAAIGFAAQVAGLEGLRLRGLMTIGANSPDAGVVRASFERMAKLSEALVASRAPGTDDARELSMGMSGDYAAAIAAGATMVRIGSAIFGPRG